MTMLLLRYQVPEEGVAEVAGAVRAAFAEVAAHGPEGLRWTYCRRPGGTEFVALVELAPGVENPLPAFAAARTLQATVAKWAVGDQPAPEPLEVIGTYLR